MMTREDYERYVRAFNARDYDTVFDFYADRPQLAFFGVEITTREQLKDFYGFLHHYVRETVWWWNALPAAPNWRRWKPSCGWKGLPISPARSWMRAACRNSFPSAGAMCRRCASISITTLRKGG